MATPQPAPSPWQNVPGSLVQVAAANGGKAAGVNSTGGIYTYDPGSSSWTGIENPSSLTQVVMTSTGNLYGLNASGNIWLWTSGGIGWGEVFPGSYTQIAVTTDDTLYAINNTQVFNLASGMPVQVGSTINGTISQFDVGDTNSIVLVNGGAIFKYNPNTMAWDTVPLDPGMQIIDVTVGAEGVMYALDNSQNIYRFVGQGGDPGKKNWLMVPGSLAQISCYDGGDVWGVNRNDQIYALRVDNTVPVTITFDPNNKLTCTPDTVTVPFGKTYKIQWTVDPTGHSGVDITAVTFDNDPPFANLSGNFGTSVVVVDNDINQGNQERSFNYTLYLTADGQSYNTDPKIINQSGGGG